MNKIILAIYLFTIIVFGMMFIVNQTALGQTSKTGSTTFSAVGTISSLNFESNSVSDIAGAKKAILSGDWSLYVNNGNLSFFEADFVAAPADHNVRKIISASGGRFCFIV